MLFSVVIPLYNKADTIERAIRSVWGQTFIDYELIVVNDGSSDCSLGVVRCMSQETPISIIDKKNGGASSARNAGAEVAKGKYIALLDGDDIWHPNHLKLLADAIRRHPHIRFFGTGYERECGDHIYYTFPWGGTCIKNVYSALRYAQLFNSSSVAIERDLWVEVGGFNEKCSFYEDYEFYFRLGLYTKCCIVRRNSVKYTQDAQVRTTKQRRVFSRLTNPHWAFVDAKISAGSATKEMIDCAKTGIAISLAWNCRKGENNICKNWQMNFPQIYGLLTGCPIKLCGVNIFSRIYAEVYYRYYQFRNHIFIWRRLAKSQEIQ